MVSEKDVVSLHRNSVPSLEIWEFQIIAYEGPGAPVIAIHEEDTLSLKFREGKTHHRLDELKRPFVSYISPKPFQNEYAKSQSFCLQSNSEFQSPVVVLGRIPMHPYENYTKIMDRSLRSSRTTCSCLSSNSIGLWVKATKPQ